MSTVAPASGSLTLSLRTRPRAMGFFMRVTNWWFATSIRLPLPTAQDDLLRDDVDRRLQQHNYSAAALVVPRLIVASARRPTGSSRTYGSRTAGSDCTLPLSTVAGSALRSIRPRNSQRGWPLRIAARLHSMLTERRLCADHRRSYRSTPGARGAPLGVWGCHGAARQRPLGAARPSPAAHSPRPSRPGRSRTFVRLPRCPSPRQRLQRSRSCFW